jgi:TRAP-type uncharacterized transport system substrate-binding protein
MYENAPNLLTSAIRLSVELPGGARNSGPPFPFTFAVSPAWCSGLEGARLVGAQKLDVAWINPSIIVTMGHLGKGPFRRALPLRALAVFPSWDRLVIAVSGKLGIRTMDELIEKRPPVLASVAVNDCVDFAIAALLKAHGLSLETFKQWGCTIDPVERPSNPRRRDGIVSGEMGMIIDEGLDSWGDNAVKHGYVFLPFAKKALKKLERYGFKRAPLGGGRLKGDFDPATEVIDYSGWPIVTHAEFPDELAYQFAAALEKIREEIPYDAERIPSMSALARGSEEAPLDIPLHPGAERYYREHGYL